MNSPWFIHPVYDAKIREKFLCVVERLIPRHVLFQGEEFPFPVSVYLLLDTIRKKLVSCIPTVTSSNRKEHTLVYSSSLGRQDRNVAVFLGYGTLEQLVSCSPNSASSNRKEHTLVYSSSLGRQDRNVAVFLGYGTLEQLVSCSPNSASSIRKEHTLVYSSSLGRQDRNVAVFWAIH
ncbi:hypothetical protein CEXT_317231 [Caerostris extrusa]|uniref:Uncharacterized protein n=1 Tax=Caerostris extrusa TaxID=172846 RepID=A0AAV4P5C4_CAEEX|nr:hypothetical protein CEXT_317231 [Caerostris extrusa]